MRKIITICIFLFTVSLSAQKFDTALDYLEFVSEQQEGITKKMWTYTKAIAHGKSDRNVNNKRKSLLKTLDRSIEKIKKAPGFDGVEFKNQLLKRLQFNKDLLNDEYAKIIDMKAVAEQSYDAMEAYMMAQELADKRMEEIQEEYEVNYYAFANKNKINIVESETDLSKNMSISNEVFSYYKNMYLIYFKVYINEIYLMDALNSNDANAIQQNANALSESAKEGLQVLKSIEHYKNDKSLSIATKKAFEFFIDEAENKVPVLTDFLVLSEDLEKTKATIEKTAERKRTKEQIDGYNAMISKFNKGVKQYNNTNTALNKKRQVVINVLNTTNQKFLSKHIPND
ncbi:LIC11966 family surface protein [Winogradskyella sp. UBA3174]|uniref:LIC11966 family surface protein n=1 Tax=Winogradskyella sp. UBA3174 TaxID=1947785 RepID=UPI0025D55C4E|nr:hypothetical protein [Winogradskyella sp. UBA3174]|tara:strand:+ start:38403 stop:39428 length:1026 start_codon:yes stop_codon:yes gene_type:complete